MQFLEGQTVGIDLGTTFSAIAQLNEEGHPISLKNADGKSITPSVVLFGEDGHVIVGPTLERMAQEDPKNIVEAIKRQMGNKDFYVVYQDKKLTPEFISALILKKMKQDAEAHIGAITNSVITVPYYFNDVRRKATQDAGQIAGLNVIDIINEPTAATLSYAWQQGELGRADLGDTEKTILVYDLGGGTFDVTVVRYTPTSFRVLATDGDVMLGGLDWSRRLVDHVSEQFEKKFSEDPREDPETMMNMTQDCEEAKRDLSERAQVPVTVYYKGKSLTVSLTRGDFERMTSDLMQRTRDTTELVMQQAGMKPRPASTKSMLVGGSTYMPVVEAMLMEVTGNRAPSRSEGHAGRGRRPGRQPFMPRFSKPGRNRKGLTAGLDARAVINRSASPSIRSDVNSHSLGVKITDPGNNRARKINHIMIPKNSPDCRIKRHSAVRHQLTRTSSGSTSACSKATPRDPDACTTIGDFRVVYDLPPESSGRFAGGGHLRVRQERPDPAPMPTELTSNKSTRNIEIERSQGLDIDGVSSVREAGWRTTMLSRRTGRIVDRLIELIPSLL